jgi:hypothetical protein
VVCTPELVRTPEPGSATAERIAVLRELVGGPDGPGRVAAEHKKVARTAAPPFPGGGTTAVPARDTFRVRAGLRVLGVNGGPGAAPLSVTPTTTNVPDAC